MMSISRKSSESGKTGIVILIVVIVLVLGIFIAVWAGYNKAVRLDEQAKSSWKQVDVQLTRRFDLIPNLVETVKGYAKHEKELFEHIADTRTKYFQAKGVQSKVRAANEFQGVLSRLMMLQERYPDLKANQNFAALQVQLEGTENRIAVSRKDYNDSVRKVNTYARSFFGRSFCSMADVEQAEYFEATEEQKAPTKVKF
jgi:LemA protein